MTPSSTSPDVAERSRADWRTRSAGEANRQWYIWRSQHGPADRLPPDFEVELKEAFAAGFPAGARWSFVESAKLAPAIASMADFVDWLRSAGTAPSLDLEEVRTAWLAVKEWIGPPRSREHRGALEEMDVLLGLHEERG